MASDTEVRDASGLGHTHTNWQGDVATLTDKQLDDRIHWLSWHIGELHSRLERGKGWRAATAEELTHLGLPHVVELQLIALTDYSKRGVPGWERGNFNNSQT